MLRTLLRMKEPFYIARQEEAPLLREREAFLEHLLEQGSSVAAVRGIAWQLLNIIRLLKLTRLRDIWIGEIEEAAQRWASQQRSNPLARSYQRSASYFTYVAKRRNDCCSRVYSKKPAIPRMRFADEIEAFIRWITEERGISALTARSHQLKTAQFLKWASERRRSLAAVRLTMWATS